MRTAAWCLMGLAFLLSGCPAHAGWVAAQGRFVAEDRGFEVDPPPGWMRFDNPKTPGSFLLTRDGTALQRIAAGAVEVGQPLPVGGSKRPLAKGMTPAELAELVVDGFSSQEGVTEVRVLRNEPARLGGQPGFHLLAAFRDGKLERHIAYRGALHGDRLYWIFYVAPARRYFELDEPTFEAVARSFRIRGAPAAPVTPIPAAPPAT